MAIRDYQRLQYSRFCDRFPECFFLSLSQHGAPHPLAHSARLCTGSNTCWLQEFPEEIAIVGDLIEWTVFGVDTSLSVYNWKTGEEWRHGACVWVTETTSMLTPRSR